MGSRVRVDKSGTRIAPCPARYREPGSNRHAHHWAKDFKSFLSTNSNIAAVAFSALDF